LFIYNHKRKAAKIVLDITDPIIQEHYAVLIGI